MEKKLFSLLVLFVIFFSALPLPAEAQDEESYLTHTSSGNAFGAGDNLQIDQDIQGDLVLAGSVLEINGNIMDDFIGAGGELVVNGDVSGNIMAIGGTIRVNGDVGGDLVVTGGQIFLSQGSTVEGDILLAGGNVILNGVVNGDGSVSAGTLRTGEEFELRGDLELEAENYPSDLEEDVGGNLNVTTAPRTQEPYAGAPAGLVILFSFILELLAALVLGFILIYTFPAFVTELAEVVRFSTLKAGLVGFLLLVLVPLVSIILLFTAFGWSLSILLILLFSLALLIATVPVKLLAGAVIYIKAFKKESSKLMYYLVGTIVITIVYQIPFLGWLVRFIALIIGLGAAGIWLARNAKAEK